MKIDELKWLSPKELDTKYYYTLYFNFDKERVLISLKEPKQLKEIIKLYKDEKLIDIDVKSKYIYIEVKEYESK